MQCYHPITAYKSDTGDVYFAELKRNHIHSTLILACGRCVGCRLNRVSQWALRCVHEASLHDRNCFVTLTYNNENLPIGGTLHYEHFQAFIRRLRKYTHPTPVRFYMAGEYGDRTSRPHYHALLFGFDWPDKVRHIERKGYTLYTSKLLDEMWRLGNCTTGEVNQTTAEYTARYVMKKITGQKAKQHYTNINTETGEITERKPEFNKMSLKPGIGARWLEKFTTDVYPHGKVVNNQGKEVKSPRYYDKLWKREHELELEQLNHERHMEGLKHLADNTDDRLRAKEAVTTARLNLRKRPLE